MAIASQAVISWATTAFTAWRKPAGTTLAAFTAACSACSRVRSRPPGSALDRSMPAIGFATSKVLPESAVS